MADDRRFVSWTAGLMAIEAEAVAGGEAGGAEAAGASKGLSPEAKTAVSQAAAGRGRRLSPEVSRELRRRASRKPQAATESSDSSDGGGVSLPNPSGAV